MTPAAFVASVCRANGIASATWKAICFDGPGWWGVFIYPKGGEYHRVSMLWDERQDVVIKGTFERRGA